MLACALLTSCDAKGQQGGPLEAALKFYEAVKKFRCDEVWVSYSAGTQENYRAAARRYERERDGPPRTGPLAGQYCGWEPHILKRGSARIARQQGDEAVVAADFSVEAPRHRWDLFPPTVVRTEELRLVREGGAWRVERPRLPVGRAGARLTEVGPVDVYHPAGGKVYRDLAYQLEATVVARAPRHRLESVLRDSTLWARALPSVNAVEPLERTGEQERVRLVFAEPERSLTVAVRDSGKPADPKQPGDTRLQWDAEGGNKAPIYFRGRWELKPHHDGTRVTLVLLLIPKQWPGDAAGTIVSAERMAQAVQSLEKAALKAAP